VALSDAPRIDAVSMAFASCDSPVIPSMVHAWRK
jgi:hypothetical protein